MHVVLPLHCWLHTVCPIQVREHCQSLLSDALKRNAAECTEGSASESDLEDVAAQVEYSIFNTIRVSGSYRLVINKKVCWASVYSNLSNVASSGTGGRIAVV